MNRLNTYVKAIIKAQSKIALSFYYGSNLIIRQTTNTYKL